MTISDVEELFKSEEFAKAIGRVDRGALANLFRHTEMLKNPKLSAEERTQIENNIKAIVNYKKPKQLGEKPKKSKVEVPQSLAPAKAPIKPKITHKYSPIYVHYGVTKEHWDNPTAPDAHESVFNFHNEVLAGKHPEYAHVKNIVEQHRSKMQKSLENIYTNLNRILKTLN
jgi:hypothetical protein